MLDTVAVGGISVDSAGKSAFKRGVEAALQVATGIAIWRIP
jgi:hypothetical protein